MNNLTSFKAPLALMVALAAPLLTNGCSAADNPLCCTEFKAGATIDANIGGGAEAQVAVQAVADFAGIAAARHRRHHDGVSWHRHRPRAPTRRRPTRPRQTPTSASA